MAEKEYTQEQKKKRAAKRKARRRKRKRILLVFEGVLLVLLFVAAYVALKFSKLDISPIDPDKELIFNEEVKENVVLKEYCFIWDRFP